MRVLISGGSGLVGSALTERLRADGHTVGHIMRAAAAEKPGDVRWDPDAATVDMRGLEGAEAVVHLGGASIAEGKWTPGRKIELRHSRVGSTRVLVDALAHLKQRPRVLVCASAVGYYGNRGDELLTEASSYGTDFLGLLARDWEAEAARAALQGIRTVMLRFGVVLSAQGGALPKMLEPFRRGFGGRLGSGRQWLAWVALADAVEAARGAIVDERFGGPVNVVAPNPVRNEEFTRVVAQVLHRRAIFPAPAFALRLVLGEMADALLLSSQHVRPERLLEWGFKWRYENLENALRGILEAGKAS